jgi:branched-chain amino acid transport system ATP-binding protein
MRISESDQDILALTHVDAGYGESLILHDISLTIRKGKITTLIGANGAGKSTLLRVVFGTVRVTRGAIHYGSQVITGASSLDRLRMGIGYSPQGRCNFPGMTIRENLEMGAYLRSDTRVRADIEEVLQLFPILRGRERDLAGNLSGGQQQVLEMAMALMLRPKLLLLDEPSIGLSPALVDQTFAHVRTINQQGVTVLMVEQNARRALTISDYGVVLELGRIRLEDTGEVILKNEEVRRHYLGSGSAHR